ncbi:tyrosine decarboxylase-like [Onthophagus taurus]|uniref:tyrosine decarboxylase-like n=1 Tax=Onthophagus taurus TaxID=166361 RepID=UPI000C1FDE72|nr:tyrosine decarboxylase-like [Onthophagus taurus]
MDIEDFRIYGKQMVDYICKYLGDLEEKRVTSNVEPGYLTKLLPNEAPFDPEDWEQIKADIDSKIMPGITHWQHPHFHAYFPSGNSFPSILGDMLADAIGCIGFSWAASPACTELETIVLDWYGKAIGLPSNFITSQPNSKGGGVIESSASECVLVTMLAARNAAINYLKKENTQLDDSIFLPKLIAYCSKEAHSCVEKAAKILLVKLRELEPDENGSLRGEALQNAIEEDEANGLTPFFVSATLGSTGSCAFDNIEELGRLCVTQSCTWLHVDAAYAGSAFICPELKYLMSGIEYADSFNANPNKFLLVNFDCSVLWVKNRLKLTTALIVDPLYLQHANSNQAIDYRHWGISLSRRFRSLKLWFVMRKYGISGLQNYIRNHIKLATYFASLVRNDKRFEVMNDVVLGLVCLRLIAPDAINRNLLAKINLSGHLHMIPSCVRGKFVLRFCVVSERAKNKDMDYAWSVIKKFADEVMSSLDIPLTSLSESKAKRFSFTRSVSWDIYKKSLRKGSLYDGATPILVPDDEEMES